MRLVMSLIDEDDGWNGPTYAAEHIFAMDSMQYSQTVNKHTSWDGKRAFRLMSLSLPAGREAENADQKQAREMVEACLGKSFSVKLAHGRLVLNILGHTLGSLWRKHEGSDDIPGTYAHWLRYGTIHWNQVGLPLETKLKFREPLKRGHLLCK